MGKNKTYSRVFDMFASNGSTYFDKEFFGGDDVFRNDLRHGEYYVMEQKLKIYPDISWDAFIKWQPNPITCDVVYMDPPHLKFGSTGLMVQKYTTLPLDWKNGLDNMFRNAWRIAPVAILKWNSGSIATKEVLKIAEKYYYIAFGNRRDAAKGGTSFITLISRREELEDV